MAGAVVAAALATGLSATAPAASRATPRGRSPVSGRIHLDHDDVASGRIVGGELVFDNHTTRSQVLLSGCKIDGLYAIALRAPDGYLQQPAFSSVACGPDTIVAKPGRTVYRFRLRATYTHCIQSAGHQPPRRSENWAPLCLKNTHGDRDIMPPLPAGRYTAVFVPDGEWHGPSITPAGLTVTHGVGSR